MGNRGGWTIFNPLQKIKGLIQPTKKRDNDWPDSDILIALYLLITASNRTKPHSFAEAYHLLFWSSDTFEGFESFWVTIVHSLLCDPHEITQFGWEPDRCSEIDGWHRDLFTPWEASRSLTEGRLSSWCPELDAANRNGDQEWAEQRRGEKNIHSLSH